MYLATIILPFLASIVSGFFGRKVGINGSQLVTTLLIVITTFISLVIFNEITLNHTLVSIFTFRWIDTELLNVMWGFNYDTLTSCMLIPVLIISFLVHVYSIGYMNGDPHNQRFFSYLSLFTFMMVILVTANNFLLMFVGWEGVGVCSYLLVNFWFTRIAANQSSMSAFLTNRVGDCFLTLGMFAIISTFGSLDYSVVFSLAPYVSENSITCIGICLLIGAMAKSSQVGLHVWLPLAMEGPTPVSALIHAATMVTAGVYLLVRSSPLIEYSSTVLMLCLWIGSITTIFSSLIGLFQQDIKKVIAYSTMSQLGMMVIAIGLSSYNLALFHLVNHAFYKGLLFLGAGSVIHAVSDNQDFRKYGALIKFLPLTYTVMLIASLSLVAFPFMTGFYSKDFILESSFAQFTYSSISVYFIAVIGAVFTTLYSAKVLYSTFITNPNGPLTNYKNSHESDIFMVLPLIILSLFSVFFGYICKDMFIGLGTNIFVDNSIFIHPLHESVLSAEFAVPLVFKILPFIFTILLSLMYVYITEFVPNFIIYLKSTILGYNVFNLFSMRFLVEAIYNKYIVNLVLKLGAQTTKILDKGSIEYIGPYGIGKLLFNLSKFLTILDSGIVTSYALYMVVGVSYYVLTLYLFNSDTIILFLLICGMLAIAYFNNYVNYRDKNKNNIITKSTLHFSLNDARVAICASLILLLLLLCYMYTIDKSNIDFVSHFWCFVPTKALRLDSGKRKREVEECPEDDPEVHAKHHSEYFWRINTELPDAWKKGERLYERPNYDEVRDNIYRDRDEHCDKCFKEMLEGINDLEEGDDIMEEHPGYPDKPQPANTNTESSDQNSKSDTSVAESSQSNESDSNHSSNETDVVSNNTDREVMESIENRDDSSNDGDKSSTDISSNSGSNDINNDLSFLPPVMFATYNSFRIIAYINKNKCVLLYLIIRLKQKINFYTRKLVSLYKKYI